MEGERGGRRRAVGNIPKSQIATQANDLGGRAAAGNCQFEDDAGIDVTRRRQPIEGGADQADPINGGKSVASTSREIMQDLIVAPIRSNREYGTAAAGPAELSGSIECGTAEVDQARIHRCGLGKAVQNSIAAPILIDFEQDTGIIHAPRSARAVESGSGDWQQVRGHNAIRGGGPEIVEDLVATSRSANFVDGPRLMASAVGGHASEGRPVELECNRHGAIPRDTAKIVEDLIVAPIGSE